MVKVEAGFDSPGRACLAYARGPAELPDRLRVTRARRWPVPDRPHLLVLRGISRRSFSRQAPNRRVITFARPSRAAERSLS